MVNYILDTNICIALLKGTDAQLLSKIKERHPTQFHLCSVVKAELCYGACKSERRLENENRLKIFFKQFSSLPFEDGCAQLYGEIRASLEKTGEPIGPNDLMIAATCLFHGKVLLTRNFREFSRIAVLKTEIW